MSLDKPPLKDMKKVKDYNDENQLRMFRFSCFNNASTIVALNPHYKPYLMGSDIPVVVFDLAEKLYKEGVEKDYLRLKKGDENVKNN